MRGVQVEKESRFHLLLVISISDCEETLSKQNLELFDKEILRIIDANEGADDIARLVRPEVYSAYQSRYLVRRTKTLTWTSIDGLGLPIWVCVVIYLNALQWLNGFVIVNQ